MADTPIGFEVRTTGATYATLVAAPAASAQRIVNTVDVFNADTVAHVFTLKKSKGANDYVFATLNIPAGGSDQWSGRQVLDATDESLQVKADAAATTTESDVTAAAMECTA